MSTANARPRTIVMVMVDQLAAKWLEVARDHDVVDLPNFDAMQSEGTTFTRALTPNPVCSPARASLATGMPTPSHGLTECGYRLDPSVPTFMQALQAAGWRTGAFGKLHLVPQLEALRPDYRSYGFDVIRISEDPRAGEWTDWVRATHPDHYDAALATVWMTMIDELREYGPEKEDLRARILSAQRRHPECKQEAYVLPYPEQVSQTAWITNRAVEFLEAAEGDQDVFAHVSYVQPHNPFAPPPEYVDRVRVENIPEPLRAEWADEPIPYYRQDRYARPSYDTCDWRRDRHLYFADLAHLDHELCRIRRTLEHTGRATDAMVIFTSDHGELLHDHGLLGKWERHYDACIRVPLIVNAPGTSAGECDALVELTDIATTIYDWAGLPHPTAPARDPASGAVVRADLLTGRSLLPFLTDQGHAHERAHLLVQSNNSHLDGTPRSWARTVRTNRYRYSRHLSGGGEQLFDLDTDPDEQYNLAYDKAHEGVRANLLDMLAEISVTDAFPNSPRQLYQLGSW